jgi:hypothetical protein
MSSQRNLFRICVLAVLALFILGVVAQDTTYERHSKRSEHSLVHGFGRFAKRVCPVGDYLCTDGGCCPAGTTCTTVGTCVNPTNSCSGAGDEACGTQCCDSPLVCSGGTCISASAAPPSSGSGGSSSNSNSGGSTGSSSTTTSKSGIFTREFRLTCRC